MENARRARRIEPPMTAPKERPDSRSDKGNPTLFIVILAIVIVMLAVFLILRPRGSEAGASQKTGSSSSQN